MEKVRPRSNGKTRLTVRGYFAAFRTGQETDTVYEIVDGGTTQRLDDVQWADWDTHGGLLVATTESKLQIREFSDHRMVVRSEVDLSLMSPEPSPPLDEAHRW